MTVILPESQKEDLLKNVGKAASELNTLSSGELDEMIKKIVSRDVTEKNKLNIDDIIKNIQIDSEK